jgi:uncharacterized membrane-anchored protein
MKKLTLTILCLLALLVGLPVYAEKAEEENLTEQQKEQLTKLANLYKKIAWQTGNIKLNGGMAELNLPTGYRYCDPQSAKIVLEDIWGNPPGAGSNTLGMVFPEGQDPMEGWGIVLSFIPDGYVSDEDADKINYNDLLKQMQEGNIESNKEREKMGYGTMLLKGWALPPRYDKAKKVMYWAKEFQTGAEQNTLNYDVRVLGRRGVLSLNGVATADETKDIDAATPAIVGMVIFNQGHRYADYVPGTDKKADYTLAGLVIGGAVAAKLLAKGGILVLLAKFGKILILPALGIGIWLKNKFSGNR